ncbi:MAG: N-(5-phosphoribosyl)anthranilate isomerase [Planctomycetota bacterium]|jgi:phosphoribosylanthranilate isomerase
MWVKICGIIRNEDAAAAVLAGVDAIGLNFFPGSKRYVSLERAVQLQAAIAVAARSQAALKPPEVIGVFVNADIEAVLQTARAVPLTGVQFHGDESAELIADCMQQLPGVKCIRAFRVSVERLSAVISEVDRLQSLLKLDAVLFDAFVAGEYGGTGHKLPSALLSGWESPPRPPLVLAGGLTPENICEAVVAVRPWGVDTASGVEVSPGIKDHRRMSDFVNGARSADAAVAH